MKKITTISALIVMLTPLASLAHAGHGNIPDSNLLHYTAEPLHLLVLLVVLSAIAGLVYRYTKQSKKQ